MRFPYFHVFSASSMPLMLWFHLSLIEKACHTKKPCAGSTWPAALSLTLRSSSPSSPSRNQKCPWSSPPPPDISDLDRKSTRLNSSHSQISYAVFCLKKKKTEVCLHVHSVVGQLTRQDLAQHCVTAEHVGALVDPAASGLLHQQSSRRAERGRRRRTP